MEGRTLNYFRILLFSTLIFTGGLFSTGQIGSTSAFAFFENQAQYAFKHRWLPMLGDASPEKRFQAMRAFLTYPEWGLPVLRSSIMIPESENVSWQIVMLIGMLGDSSDVQPLLKIWLESENNKRSSVWLGAMQRLYWKNRVSGDAAPKLTNLSVKFDEKDSANQSDVKTASILFRIDNPSPAPRFIRVSAHFWKTRIKENLPEKYFWLPAGGRIESSMQTKLLVVDHTNDTRLDFRIWEVGLSDQLLHQTLTIPFPEESTSPVSN